MRTQYIQETSAGTPWLEHFLEEDGKPQRTYLEKFPFTIGRNESADLQIDSNRVSREHAVIVEKSRGTYFLRDLKSTNGTFVNGQRIQESALEDGDLLAVADFELTFSANRGGAQPYTVTHPMGENDSDGPSSRRSSEILQSLRLGGETLLQGVGSVRFQPIYVLHGGNIQGYEATIANGERQLPGNDARRVLSELPGRLTFQLRHVDRLLALDEAMQLPVSGPILFRLTAAETQSEPFSASLNALEHLADETRRIVLAVPYSTVKSDPAFAEKVRSVQNTDVGLAVYDFPAEGHEDFFPANAGVEWLLFEHGVTRGLQGNIQRQQELRSLSTAARKAGCELVATGIHSAAEAELCRHCGCRLGQGSWHANASS
jgi:pSer/pThr/pTyr-binding forkhead associated (FHA) protein